MLLKLENVNYTYMPGTPFETAALKNANLEVEQGEYLAVIGETGSGKSTLVQHLNGLLRPTTGRVLLEGRDVTEKGELAALRRRVGLLFQFPEHQLFEETVYADVAFGPKNLGLTEAEVKERVEKALTLVGLDSREIARRSPFSLSGGQMRRVAMAGVLAMEPDVIILDEPAAGLDPRGKGEIFDQVDKLHTQHGLTVVLVSHSMEDVASRAGRLVVLAEGEIKTSGTPAEVFADALTLENMGLALPQMAILMHRLRQAGKDVPTDIFTVPAAKEAILAMLGGNRK
ncbi:energy-coupling factor transporter ATPase [Dethiobacter alkaliphilus]|uniref:energy-coupling factor transporter ATPase n=1 Tax=Dethiobacter alkaliphilus TaxID=427926 RepID=UPI0022261F6C|nr:energy-coupling factor transporter ATPase [Dethiobacter alkaliphilus]MCW3491114.1 energy-coupling factor transporter ATPase [Dethiobacter alkaliphilus]